MTATTANTQPPWKVRWLLYGFLLFCILAIPGPTRAVGLQLVHNFAHIVGVDDEGPIELSPTNPPVVNP